MLLKELLDKGIILTIKIMNPSRVKSDPLCDRLQCKFILNMSFIKQLERFEQLHQLIELRSTGSPNSLSEKLNISRSMLFVLLQTLKERGARIKFSSDLNFYYYEEPFCIRFGYTNLELIKIRGGCALPVRVHKYWTTLN